MGRVSAAAARNVTRRTMAGSRRRRDGTLGLDRPYGPRVAWIRTPGRLGPMTLSKVLAFILILRFATPPLAAQSGGGRLDQLLDRRAAQADAQSDAWRL